MADYVHGNPRVEAAIMHALQWIPADAERILDVGCGIGWSTWEIKRHCPEAEVIGIELSPKMTAIARLLFQTPQLSYLTHDIISGGDISGHIFDSIVMLDVYEHIPKELRNDLHRELNKFLASDGQVVLTCPSSLHQQFLREHQPDGLQPVDENVTLEDISKLAHDIKGEVVYFNHNAVWHSNDYIHAVIKRNLEFTHTDQSKERRSIALESQRDRVHRLHSCLDIKVRREGVISPAQERPVVCIITPNENIYSETFIRAHIEQLPAKVKVISGGWYSSFKDDGRPLLPFPLSPAVRVMLAFPHIFPSLPKVITNFALKRFLSKHRVDVVLAEYGPTGAAVMDACVQAGVPLVVHFHGYDAYQKPILEEVGSAYRRMFSVASAIVVVSHEMKQQLHSLGAPEEKVFYNVCGVNSALFSGGNPANARPVCIAVGRFVDKKTPHLTILAFKEVVGKCPDARLIMVGDGPLLDSSKQLARALGIAEAVEFSGVRPHAEVAAMLRQARMLVQHSVRAADGDSEGTPVVVLEAGATGLPVIATDHAGIRDVVVDGQTGFLVKEGDVGGMAECMIRLVEEPALANRLGKAARERICSEFTMQKSIANLWRIITASIQEEQGS
jgi:glycosyltransferase involved in cell wall biosynthesis/protein-L-isoaspartate O-methyltransferase